MIAAVYARKSTEQHVAAEAEVRHAPSRARAPTPPQGWHVRRRVIFVDDGISGGEFEKRPAFLRLMNALTPTPPFQVLIMTEESRFGREQMETIGALQRLVTAGVHVFSISPIAERTLDSPIGEAMMRRRLHRRTEREKARQRARDKAAHLARAGHVTGGACFGYTNVRVNSHVEQRINEREGAVVHRIFELAAEGVAQPRIAKLLNAEGALTPRAQRGRPCAWAQSSVHAVLHRSRYKGDLVWNRTSKCDRWGQHRQTDRDPREWITVHVPDLQIVSDALWQAAHARIASVRSVTNIRAKS